MTVNTNTTLSIEVDVEQAIRLRRALRTRIRDLRAKGIKAPITDLQPVLDVLDEFVPAGRFPTAFPHQFEDVA